MTDVFGAYVRGRREARRRNDRAFSVRQVAARIGIEPSYLSKIERGEQRPPSEATIVKLDNEVVACALLQPQLLGPVGRVHSSGLDSRFVE